MPWLLLVLGCEAYWSPEPTDPGDTGLQIPPILSELTEYTEPYLGDLTLALIQLSCQRGVEDTWVWEVSTLGWTQSATIDWFHGDSRTHESHTLPSVESGPWGHWDILERQLPVSTNGRWQQDLKTSYGCHLEGELTQVVRIYDATDTLAECAIWGRHVEMVLRDATDWSTPVRDSDELEACENWRVY